jgi:hypothetical protein
MPFTWSASSAALTLILTQAAGSLIGLQTSKGITEYFTVSNDGSCCESSVFVKRGCTSEHIPILVPCCADVVRLWQSIFMAETFNSSTTTPCISTFQAKSSVCSGSRYTSEPQDRRTTAELMLRRNYGCQGAHTLKFNTNGGFDYLGAVCNIPQWIDHVSSFRCCPVDEWCHKDREYCYSAPGLGTP